MPNPYHDETGRFCSAGEMSAAISRLVGQGKWEEAQTLEQEYNQLTKTAANPGFDETAVARNEELTRISALGERRELTDPANIIHTETWSDEEIDNQIALAGKRKEDLEKENVELTSHVEEVINKFKEEFQTTQTPSAAYMKSFAIKNRGEEILRNAFEKAREAGVPSSFARYYVYDRVAPALGIKDGTDYRGRPIFAKKELTPFSAASLPKVKELDRREKLAAVFTALQNDEQVQSYDNDVTFLKPLLARAEKDSTEVSSATRKISDNEKNIANQTRTQEILSTVKQWRGSLSSAGLSANSKIVTAGGSGSKLTVNKNGEINNAWGYNKGKLDKIVGVEKLGYPEGAAQLIGESGSKYYNLTHYHSFKRFDTTSHVVVDPTVAGENYQTTQLSAVSFSYIIDSGD